MTIAESAIEKIIDTIDADGEGPDALHNLGNDELREIINIVNHIAQAALAGYRA